MALQRCCGPLFHVAWMWCATLIGMWPTTEGTEATKGKTVWLSYLHLICQL